MEDGKHCIKISSQYLLPSWGCCQCRTFNGDQRVACKHCAHPRCDGMNHEQLGQEVHLFLEALADWFFIQQDRHPVRAAVTYRHTLRALGEADALRVELGGQSRILTPSNDQFRPPRA